MRARILIVSLFFMLGGFLSFADHAFADTVVDSDISEDTAWTKAGSPYLVQGEIAVNQNAILSIEPGVIVQFDANGMAVFGRLLAKGSPDEPITFTSSTGSRWGGIEFYNQEAISSLDNVIVQHAYAISDYLSKNLSISNTKIKDGVYGIVAYGSHLFLENFSAENMSDEALDISYGSDVILKNLFLKNVEMSVQVYVNSKADISNLFIDGARGEALAVYVGSSVRVASSTIKNVLHSYGAVETFVNSSLDISNLTLEKVSGGDALAVFDDSKMFVLNSSISDTANSEVVSALYLGSLTLKNVKITNGTGDGLAVYAGGFVDVQDSVISGFTHGAGVADYGSNSSYYPVNGLSLTNSEIKDNNVGIGLYSNNSSYAISNNSIHQNASHGLESYGSALADVSSNFWGDSSGPYNDPDNLIGTGDGIWYAPGSTVIFSPWLSSWGIPPVSNVLFLPGLEASRLYRPGDIFGTDQLWEPNTDSDTQDLFLTADGKSVRNDVYTKDVIDEKNVLPLGQGNVYKSFIAQMDGLKTAGTINDWEAVPYDWRLSLDDILSSGNQFPDGRIYYSGSLAATSSPYLVQELRRLAKSSKTGKVTIVAHSNGGLVAKALTQKLGSEAANLIDKIIFVAVPQVGTPQAVGAILHGYDQGLPFDFAPLILTPETARTFATNMPSAYNLLPSANYFTRIATPVATFDNSDFLAEFRSRYGSAIQDGAQLKNFITDTRRLASSSPSDLKYPSVGNALLLSQAETVHSTFDAWTPPQGVPLYEIAGWGEDTLATIEYYKGRTASCSNPLNIFSCSIVPTIMYNPKEVVDGDGTVLVPSALWSTASTTKKYWVDLGKYNKFIPDFFATKHADILEVPSLRILVQNILTNSTSTAPLSFITTTQPITDVAADKRLRFVLHSPLNLSATDNLGNTVSSATSTIPGSRFKRYGEVQVLTVPKDIPLTLSLDGYATGSFTLDMQEVDGSNAVTASSTFSAIPSATSTKASISFTDGTIQNASPLLLDYDGNGAVDFSLQSRVGKEVVFDTTPPEAVLTFDPLSQTLKISGTDDLSSTTVRITATSTTIADESGNTLQIVFKKLKREGKELKLELQELLYNGVSAGVIPKTVLHYEWSTDKLRGVKELEEKATVGPLTIEGHYDAKKNVTKIERKMKDREDREEKESKKILPGLVLFKFATDNGKVEISY